MTLPFVIRSEADYERAVRLVDELWSAQAGTAEAQILDVMAHLVSAWEREHGDIEPGDPRDIIRFKLAEFRWSQNELARRIGWSSGRVSEVLAGRRRLTLRMVRELSRVLDLPAGLLVHDLEVSL
jgi:HTH-type transcriptional regulator/antitoxin HigA